MIIGCDTGLFVEFIAKNPVVRQLMERAVRGEHKLISSVICVYELKKLGLTGMVSRDAAFAVAADLSQLCEVVFTTRQPVLSTKLRVFHTVTRSVWLTRSFSPRL